MKNFKKWKIIVASKILLKRFVSGYKALNNKKYIGVWIDWKYPLPGLMSAILRTCNHTQKEDLRNWLDEYVGR